MHANPALIDVIAGRKSATLALHRLSGTNSRRRDLMMMSDRIIQLCKSVERLACELDSLTARGHAGTTHAVLLRMKLAAMTSDLVTADLIERMQKPSRVVKASA